MSFTCLVKSIYTSEHFYSPSECLYFVELLSIYFWVYFTSYTHLGTHIFAHSLKNNLRVLRLNSRHL